MVHGLMLAAFTDLTTFTRVRLGHYYGFALHHLWHSVVMVSRVSNLGLVWLGISLVLASAF